MTFRECTTCGVGKPATLEFFPPNKDCKFGLSPQCRTCRREYVSEWKAQNAERVGQRRRALYAERHAEAQAEKDRERKATHPLRVRAGIMRQGMIDRSRKTGLPFDAATLTIAQIMGWIERTPTCPCCDQAIDYTFKGTGRKNDASPSIDRIDHRRGYVVGNVALICWRCNNLKRDATIEELEAVTRWMRAHATPPLSIVP